jgi:hypothetical protein
MATGVGAAALHRSFHRPVRRGARAGQAIDFQAFDLYHVVDGRIAENWHLEDNLTLLQQMGLMSGPQSAPAKRNELAMRGGW